LEKLKTISFGAKLHSKLLNIYPELNQYVNSMGYAPFHTLNKIAKKNSQLEVFQRPNFSEKMNKNGSPTNIKEIGNLEQYAKQDKF
jgi:hypothetical protein